MPLFYNRECPIAGQKDRAYLNADQSVAASATATVELDAETFGSALSSHKVKVGSAGYYFIKWKVSGSNLTTELMKNSASLVTASEGADVFLLDKDDEVWLQVTDTSGSTNTITGGEYATYLTVIELA